MFSDLLFGFALAQVRRRCVIAATTASLSAISDTTDTLREVEKRAISDNAANNLRLLDTQESGSIETLALRSERNVLRANNQSNYNTVRFEKI